MKYVGMFCFSQDFVVLFPFTFSDRLNGFIVVGTYANYGVNLQEKYLVPTFAFVGESYCIRL